MSRLRGDWRRFRTARFFWPSVACFLALFFAAVAIVETAGERPIPAASNPAGN